MKTKGGKVAALKDNIRIRWKGLGWMECEMRWSVDGHELILPKLENRSKELIRMQHKKKWVIPDKPAVLVTQRKNITFLGTATRQVGELDKKAKGGGGCNCGQSASRLEKAGLHRVWKFALKHAAL